MINKLQGNYLSNFWECKVEYAGIVFRNAESAFQAQKCADGFMQTAFINLSGAQAKALGKKVKIIPELNEDRLYYMTEVLEKKFEQNPELAKQLVATGDEEIVEGNWWGDTYWGVCNGIGENHLGKILMWIREKEKTIERVNRDYRYERLL
jgi:ribA/ribD-fused uncharacterized protein